MGRPASDGRDTPNALDILKVCVPAFSAVVTALTVDASGKQQQAITVLFWLAISILCVTIVWAPVEYLLGPYLSDLKSWVLRRITRRQRREFIKAWLDRASQAMPLWLRAAKRSIDDADEQPYHLLRDWFMRNDQSWPTDHAQLFRRRLNERYLAGRGALAKGCYDADNPFRFLYQFDAAVRLEVMMMFKNGESSIPAGEMIIQVLWESALEFAEREGIKGIPAFATFATPQGAQAEPSS